MAEPGETKPKLLHQQPQMSNVSMAQVVSTLSEYEPVVSRVVVHITHLKMQCGDFLRHSINVSRQEFDGVCLKSCSKLHCRKVVTLF